MKPKTQRFSIYQISFVSIWWTSFLVSGFAYWPELTGLGASQACRIDDVASFFLQIAHPPYWFGIFTVLLTVYGAYVLFKKLSSNWPWLADFRWLILVVIVAFILLIPLTGCN